MTRKKQNRRKIAAAYVNSVGAGKTINNPGNNTYFLPLPQIDGVQAELFIYPNMPAPRLNRLETQQIIDYATTPNLEQVPGCGADLFAQVFCDGWSFIYWPGDVAIVVKARGITAQQGVMVYHSARAALESHLATQKNRGALV